VVRLGLITASPTSNVELPRKERRERRAMNEEEALKFVEATLDDPWGLVFRFAIDTGMRPEGDLGLQGRDLDLVRGTTTVQRTLCWKRKGRRERRGLVPERAQNFTIPPDATDFRPAR
jgi:integrase